MRERTALGEEQPLSPSLRDWLTRALQLDTRRAFASAPEALSALEDIVADDSMYVAAPVLLETFLSRYIAALLELPSDSAAGRTVRGIRVSTGINNRPCRAGGAASGGPVPLMRLRRPKGRHSTSWPT